MMLVSLAVDRFVLVLSAFGCVCLCCICAGVPLEPSSRGTTAQHVNLCVEETARILWHQEVAVQEDPGNLEHAAVLPGGRAREGCTVPAVSMLVWCASQMPAVHCKRIAAACVIMPSASNSEPAVFIFVVRRLTTRQRTRGAAAFLNVAPLPTHPTGSLRRTPSGVW